MRGGTIPSTGCGQHDGEDGEDGSGFNVMHLFFLLVMLFMLVILSYLVSLLGKYCGGQPTSTAPNDEANRVNRLQEARARAKLVRSHLVVREWQADDYASSTDASSGNEMTVDRDDNSREDESSGQCHSCAVAEGGESCSSLDEEETNDTCAICLAPFAHSDNVCESNNDSCVHVFHETCMVSWLKKQNECPVCRRIYILETV